jgi:hypothetical protein
MTNRTIPIRIHHIPSSSCPIPSFTRVSPFSMSLPLPVILVLILIAFLLYSSLDASVLQIRHQFTSDNTDYTSVLQRQSAIRGHYYVWQVGRHIPWALSAIYAFPLCDQPWCQTELSLDLMSTELALFWTTHPFIDGIAI